mmetsp:Transcript_6751/g.13407  ORF Transcript_6751/g.13407 Transcript_6751/m.13407 type:complete len:217 (+) Transcript_6751:385-1035(+)
MAVSSTPPSPSTGMIHFVSIVRLALVDLEFFAFERDRPGSNGRLHRLLFVVMDETVVRVRDLDFTNFPKFAELSFDVTLFIFGREATDVKRECNVLWVVVVETGFSSLSTAAFHLSSTATLTGSTEFRFSWCRLLCCFLSRLGRLGSSRRSSSWLSTLRSVLGTRFRVSHTHCPRFGSGFSSNLLLSRGFARLILFLCRRASVLLCIPLPAFNLFS